MKIAHYLIGECKTEWFRVMLLFVGVNFTLLSVPDGVDAQETSKDDTRFDTLVWSDEFDGPMLDYTKWEVEVNAFGGGNQELQIYTDRSQNVRVENGNLVIQAHHDHAAISGTSREYSSGRVRTKNRGDWTYGRIEVRARLPEGQGIWPAIWMLPTDERYGGWAASGEIDIMEMRGQTPGEVLGTLHHGGSWPKNLYTQGGPYRLAAGTFADGFHTFAIEWRLDRIEWLVDEKLVQTQTDWKSDGAPFPAPFDQPFHLLINVAVGGQFLGPPDGTTEFPAEMQVDYVRVYQ